MPKKLNEKVRQEFLKLFRDDGYYRKIRASCRLIHISKPTFYRWMKDPIFKKEIEKIKEKRDKDPFRKIKGASTRNLIKFLKRIDRGYN